MRLTSEDQLLDQEIRRQIIQEITSTENQNRKDEAYKRYQCYKDQTRLYVEQVLKKQFSEKTVTQMSYAMANISLVPKVIDKLARVYANGVKRTLSDNPSEEDVNQLEQAEKLLAFNAKMKKNNRFLKLQKNTMAAVLPYPVTQMDGTQKYALKLEILQPYLYDVVEDFYNREEPMCMILSNYEWRHADISKSGNGIDEKIADNPEDQDADRREFIFWSQKYHFTCNKEGQIISGEDYLNPIQFKNFVPFAIDQDGSYWAIGGNDLIEGAILTNSMLTNLNHIAVLQGYGQFYGSGPKGFLPRNVEMGPSTAIIMEVEEGSTVQPQIGFASANPPISDLQRMIEGYVALLLTTNNLSTSGVKTNLGGGTDFPSAIAQAIDKAESMEDVQDQAQIFLDREPALWKILSKWLSLYGSKKLLVDEFAQIKLPEDIAVSLKFADARPIMSEQEKLQNIKLRQELGLNTEVELLQLDDPSLTEQKALERLAKIKAEKAQRMLQSATPDQGQDPNNPLDQKQMQQQNMDQQNQQQ